MGLLWAVGMGSQSGVERVLSSLPMPAFALDAKHCVWIWNNACERFTGIPAREVLGTNEHWRAFYTAPQPTLADALLDGRLDAHVAHVSGGNGGDHNAVSRSYMRWQELPNGTRKYLFVSACQLTSRAGRKIGALEIIQDLTDLQLAHEQELTNEIRSRERQKMDSIRRLAGGIAHDFNNVLTVVLGYARFIREGLGSLHPLLSNVDEILHTVERGAELTRQLLGISGKHVMTLQVVDLAGFLADLTPILRQIAGPNIRVTIDRGPSELFINADPKLLEQAIVQLVENGRDAMPNGGLLQLVLYKEQVSNPRPLRWSELSPGRYVRLSITDNGSGVSAETMRHLFEPFYSTNEQRAGLGLSIVWGILQQMRAQIAVESELGKGTRVDLFFPVADGERDERTATAVPNGEAVPRGHETVLVVEDEDAVRHLVVLMLKSLGYRVLEASDGREAIRLASTFDAPIHLILTDVVMPHMGGLELVQQLRPARKDFKVLYMSGFTDGRLLDQGWLESGDDLILKPYTRESLARKIRKVLDGQ